MTPPLKSLFALAALLAFLLVGDVVTKASAQRGPLRTSVAPTVLNIADEYVREYTDAFPEAAGLAGFQGADDARLSDRSAKARRVWEGRQDDWLARLSAVDQSALPIGSPAGGRV